MDDLYYMGMCDYSDYCKTNSCYQYRQDRVNPIFYNQNEGFVKGNIQKDIYKPYKNYNPGNISVSSDRERMLLEIQKFGFYLTDLGLYLDMHPSDNEALRLFNENRIKYAKLMEEFNKSFYPLKMCDSVNSNTYKWLEGKYPWERGN